MVLAASQSATATGSAGQVRVGVFSGAGMQDHEDLNGTINHWVDYFHWIGEMPHVSSMDLDEYELAGGVVFGGHAEYVVIDNLAVGVEFMPLSSDGGYDVDLDTYHERHDVNVTSSRDSDIEATARLVSVYGIYFLPMGGGPVALRLGGGVGYLFGAKLTVDYRSVFVYDRDWDEPLTMAGSLEASGSAVTVHGLVGAEYRATDRLLVCANVGYRVASIDELEVDRVDSWEGSYTFHNVHEGEPLRWHRYDGSGDPSGGEFSTEEGSIIDLDFSGFYLALSLAFSFGP
jgi:hypothetical protein